MRFFNVQIKINIHLILLIAVIVFIVACAAFFSAIGSDILYLYSHYLPFFLGPFSFGFDLGFDSVRVPKKNL